MALSIEGADLLGSFIEAVLYGFFVALGGFSVLAVMDDKSASRRRINTLLFFAMVLMMILSTIHVSISLFRTRTASTILFIPAKEAFVGQQSSSLPLTQNALYLVMTIIGDGVIIYRCYVVWRSLFVVLPLVLFAIGSVIAGIGTIVIQSSFDRTFNLAVLRTWASVHVTCSLTANLGATLLIAGKLAWGGARSKRLKPSMRADNPAARAAVIVLESGVLNAAVVLVLEVTVLNIHLLANAYAIMTKSVVPVIGISQALIIVQVKQHDRHRHTPYNSSTGSATIASPSSPHATAAGWHSKPPALPSKPLPRQLRHGSTARNKPADLVIDITRETCSQSDDDRPVELRYMA